MVAASVLSSWRSTAASLRANPSRCGLDSPHPTTPVCANQPRGHAGKLGRSLLVSIQQWLVSKQRQILKDSPDTPSQNLLNNSSQMCRNGLLILIGTPKAARKMWTQIVAILKQGQIHLGQPQIIADFRHLGLIAQRHEGSAIFGC